MKNFPKMLLLIPAFPRSFRFLLASYRRLFIGFPLADLSDNSGTRALFLKTPKGAVERFVVFYSNLSHSFSLPSAERQGL